MNENVFYNEKDGELVIASDDSIVFARDCDNKVINLYVGYDYGNLQLSVDEVEYLIRNLQDMVDYIKK